MPKIKFIEDAFIDQKLAFEKDSTHDLNDQSASRWVRRGKATFVEKSVIGKAAEAVKETVKEVAQKVVDAADNALNSESVEPSEGATAEAPKVEDKKAEESDNKANGQPALGKNKNKSAQGL